ncbi:MAG: efflux RND transporter periplasmic adaptor subunit [Bacteroidales bacterium]|nr:efflux RND transporter periplasmic adaptor subunit [Bacteroidales bacterium]
MIKVTVYTVSEHSSLTEREYIGVVEEANNLLLSFPAPGKVKKVYVSVGQHVKEGQMLAKTDSETLENMHATSLATLRQAEDAWERMTLLYQSGTLPEIQYVEIQTKLEQARASERIAARALAETELRAPQSGVVGKRMMEEGMNVLPDQPVLTLLNTQKSVIKVSIPENEIFDTKMGQFSRVKVGALKHLEVTGKVTEKGVQAHPYTHGYEVKITLDKEIPGLLPGMVCKVFLCNLPVENIVVIPSRAVIPEAFKKGHFVWVLDKENKAHKRAVRLGGIVQGGIKVTEGLSPQDRVIEKGHQRVSQNSKVTVVNE